MPRKKQAAVRKRRNQDGNAAAAGQQQDRQEWRTNERNYKVTERKNELFVKYYKGQNLVPEEEWDEFIETLKKDLPVTFRITGSRSQAKQLLTVIKSQFFNNLLNKSNESAESDEPPEPPKCLSWYPDELAWHIEMSRKFIRSNVIMHRLHDFLIADTESGNISRQEAVSMIPPLMLDVKSHHKILDLCAAPGSKTSQLIEYLHADENRTVPEGFVIANDKDNKRCYLMVHQVKRLQSPNIVIVNEDATIFPKIRITPEDAKPEFVAFDRILADVPCTGDATMRKNPDVWSKWKPQSGPNLHILQLKVLKRGLELLNEGGRLVYSTCSFNPIEDEAVVAEMLRQCQGAVKLVDISDTLPGLKYVKGLSTWRCMSSEGEWLDVFDNVPKKSWGVFRPSMFPPTEEEAAEMHLDRCMRILPHHQNTGGFFICALTKLKHLPWMKEKKPVEVVKTEDEVSEKSDPGENTPSEAASESDITERDGRPPQKKRRIFGFKEDPFLFAEPGDPIWPAIKDFYGIPDDFPLRQVMFRSEQGSRKNMYFVSDHIRTIVRCNSNRIKFINMGMKLMSRNPSPIVPECDFRINQECLDLLYQWFPKRYVRLTRNDAVMLLSEENPFTTKFDAETQNQLGKIGPGSVVFHFKPSEKELDPKCEIVFCGWNGKVSLRSFVSAFDRQHFLILCGKDLLEIRARVQAEKAKKKEQEDLKNSQNDSQENENALSTVAHKEKDQIQTDAQESCVMAEEKMKVEDGLEATKQESLDPHNDKGNTNLITEKIPDDKGET